MTTETLVHVIDDDPAVRDSIRQLLASIDLDVACYANARTFFDTAATARPGCILLDLRMPDMSGLDAQRRLAEHGHNKPVIFLSGHGDVEVAVQAMQQGAVDFMTKPVQPAALLEKVRDAIDADRRRQPEQTSRAAIRARLDLLSPRETEVLERVVAGETNKQIAQWLHISHKTVELHRANVMAKMHAGSLAELVRMCMQPESAPAG